MGQVEKQKMELKRKKSGRTKRGNGEDGSKEPVQSAEVDLQQLDEQMHSQGLDKEVNEQQVQREDQASPNMAEGLDRDEKQTAQETAQTAENKAEATTKGRTEEKEIISEANKRRKAMIVASKKMLDENMAENYSGIINRTRNDDLFENVLEIFKGLENQKTLSLDTASLGLEWADKINIVSLSLIHI